ncbi:hypothetical protein B0I72DRAFT_132216 [Yarrowia lipolytica]|jgi:hypothetical protein|uniref:YALI0F21285p n=2 Tax=Yarrowia lipolytica TaxID=4952 RepID=Q6C0W0_YARLI|nr:YALI0F21285p [Yarrowia lipolytica CLIB122]AOW07510.1 hypothetical protein YALI1_F28132g [Yarrowia lipolytica]KAB8286565.1 hypothetical protein BKA91DRAFT_131864 [Yarrowia lipolytica]KAE8173490.1 hypothetical protein BKA90DRAFT_135469 [Yarrowia lipolytica]KAJ8055418.1 hypothetical protein LXG23DRAFT_47452 [Yarrowia lipolytica]QNP99340.1 Hypothetical protein YALI2_E00656g [Yarrowia lipolytica]|eukprot:XP_505702.1 YALI0F21285p [Yarrowia lipolytica CLIB122]
MPKIKNVSKLSPYTVIQCDACFTNMYYRDVLEHCVDEHQDWLHLMKMEDIVSRFFYLVPLNQTLDLDNNPDYELGSAYRAATTQRSALPQTSSREDLHNWPLEKPLLY